MRSENGSEPADASTDADQHLQPPIKNRALIRAAVNGFAFIVSVAALAAIVCLPSNRESDALTRVLPKFVSAPTVAQQNQLVTAIRSHPNPPFDAALLPPLGSDAAGLASLLSSLTKTSDTEGVTRYMHHFGYDDNTRESTYLLIEVAGDPPRVIRRRVETHFDP